MSLELRVLTPEEVAEHEKYWREAAVERAWHEWELYCCAERGGHWWWLDISPDEGITLTCQACPASIDDIGSSDPELALTGEFEVCPGYVLRLDEGRVVVNDRYPADRFSDGEPFTYGWRGPVTVTPRVEKYGWEVIEYDFFIDLEPA